MLYKVMAALLLGVTPVLASIETSVFSRHVWRGQPGPSAVSVQPTISAVIDNHIGETTIEVWGQIPITGSDTEYDFTISQTLGDYGTIAITSYYFDGSFLSGENHDMEVGIAASQFGIDLFIGRFVKGNDVKEDTYIELGYTVSEYNLSVGIGDGSYTSDGASAVVSVGVGVSNEEGYGASLIINPDSEASFLVISKSW